MAQPSCLPNDVSRRRSARGHRQTRKGLSEPDSGTSTGTARWSRVAGLESAPCVESEGLARNSRRGAFATKELSKRTCDDFETLFAEGTGWGRCGCLFALQARRSIRGATWAEQREANLRTMRGLVEQGHSQGILVYDAGTLVYDAGTPMGWCQFVPKHQLRFTNTAASGADWFVTCFVIDPRYRGLGTTGLALRAAIKAIRRNGGGVVEGHATAIAHGPPPNPERKGAHRDGDVLFSGASAKIRFGVEVDGVGPVTALYRSRRSMHGAPLGGTRGPVPPGGVRGRGGASQSYVQTGRAVRARQTRYATHGLTPTPSHFQALVPCWHVSRVARTALTSVRANRHSAVFLKRLRHGVSGGIGETIPGASRATSVPWWSVPATLACRGGRLPRH
jgi:hypothetical protein